MNVYTSYSDAFGVNYPDKAIATCQNGKVYLAVDGFFGTVEKGKVVAEYENGRIYSVSPYMQNREYLIGIYENGMIYGVNSGLGGGYCKTLAIGECYGGNIYSKKDGVVGKYDEYGDGAEAAAAAAAVLLFGLTSNVHPSEDLGGMTGATASTGQSSGQKSTPSAGGGCSGVAIFVIMFLIAAIFQILSEVKEYMTLIFYVAIPILVLLISMFRKREVLLNNGFNFTGNCIKGIIKSLALSFVYVLVTVGVFMHKLSGIQVLNVDFAIGIVFVVNIITALFLAQE